MARTGRPPKYKTPEDMKKVVDEYFATLGDDKPTVTGLCIALDLTRQGLLEYTDKSDEFSDIIKKAKQKVEHALEQHLYTGQVTGAIFNLKNNFGWKDKTEKELTGKDGQPLIPNEIKHVYE